MIAVDQQGVLLLVQHDAEDGLHRVDRDLLLLGALHVEHVVADAVGSDEWLVCLGELLVHKRAIPVSADLLGYVSVG